MEADFTLMNHGSVMVLNANTPAAKAFVADHLAHPETQTWGKNGTVIEPRYWPDIERGIAEEGLVVA